nr:hypothetical protein Csa_3G176325 [Ipomoea batatas]
MHQEPPSNPVHVIRGAVFSGQHLAGVRPPAAGAVNPFTEVGDFHRKNRVLPGVPRVHQWVRGELGDLQEVNPALRVDRYGAGRGSQGGFNHGLDAQPGQRFPVRAKPVVLLGAEPHVPRNVGAGLVRVELGGFPPRGERGRGGVGGGEGDNEVADNPLLSVPPTAVPDGVNGDVGGENGAHVVLEMDEVRGALVLL